MSGPDAPPEELPAIRGQVEAMLAALRHRGPDDEGVFAHGPMAMGTRRLKVIDLAHGHQPISNEDQTVWICFNGEIFNYLELRRNLESRGHRFSTASDTEVLVHLYEDVGDRLVDQLNGQFAFAIWDARERQLVLARDRMGIRPLFYTVAGDTLIFGSEIKALLANREVPARFDPYGLQHVFFFAAPSAPRTLFQGIHQVPAGRLVTVRDGQLKERTYWDLDFFPAKESVPDLGEEHYARELERLMEDSVRLQLQAEVPVGVYVSGGLDSGVIAGLVKRVHPGPLRTFSVGFQQGFFNEMPFARKMARHVGAEAHEFTCTHRDVSAGLPAAVYFSEHPTFVTEMVPLMHLSQLARKDVVVILTGEGADEAFGGYRYFRVDKIRRLLSTFPVSLMGGLIRWLVKKKIGADHVFPHGRYVTSVKAKYGCYPAMQYEFEVGRQIMEIILADDLLNTLDRHDPAGDLGYPTDRLARWHPFDQATYFSYKMRLSNHQVSPLGDRATMANSIEGRYPFLDHRLVEFAARIPRYHKLRGFREKYILRKALGHLLPREIAHRKKQQFQAPFGSAFLGPDRPGYVAELLSESVVRSKGYFSPTKVRWVLDRLRHYNEQRPDDVNYERVQVELGLVAVLTTHLWDEIFLKGRGTPAPELVDPATRLAWFAAPCWTS
ncbi:MAG: asparagine synthase (glutamine-hydrolyzing) [Candidatus Riflebacteria bacterium]|nr:asparagine synthase (glutamine-hydrolyzing) [Candidatus Riflebacteria bacterium]